MVGHDQRERRMLVVREESVLEGKRMRSVRLYGGLMKYGFEKRIYTIGLTGQWKLSTAISLNSRRRMSVDTRLTILGIPLLK